ncbi:GNAT family N-acetyltransferase [Roseobacter sinensis]|uniref:GNAT family N-acetyltransferase n=1 Tax=Roseobacter sinensis TaxID=2931391 RepID=A0ABT3BGT7_9RHOB|nr:GNAT family N-acetyltransferase [Roseobacter sp. WL0113]MCV3272324.1 GNAT family N-acetyltransferase [Roseobacter sp. WL0113]
MTGALHIRPATSPADLDAVRTLCWEYRDYLVSFSPEHRPLMETFYPEEGYARLMHGIAEKHARPRGIILLAELDDRPVGCGMTHALNDEDAEIKRVFVRAEARGTGAGQALSQALVDQARADGYARVFLDTSADFKGAQRLYERLGFQARGPYAELPPDTADKLVFYELKL